MASIIPKIKIGLAAGRRSKHNLSFDCSTTANIGSVQPTMCREMVPNSKFKVKVSSLVRLASMPVPTFGRMSLRHYHTFIPYVDLWEPYDAMMAGQHFAGNTAGNESTGYFIPSQVPTFKFSAINKFINSYSDISIGKISEGGVPYTVTNTNVDFTGKVYEVGLEEGQYGTMGEAIKAAQAADLVRVKEAWSAVYDKVSFYSDLTPNNKFLFALGKGSEASDDKGVLNLGSYYATLEQADGADVDLKVYTDSVNPPVTDPNVFVSTVNTSPITAEGADLILEVGNYLVYYKFKPFLKRLRTIFIGLGYQFSPFNHEQFSPLKLFAYYKAWFNLFHPVREKSFVDTTCYKLIKSLSQLDGRSNIDNHGAIGSLFYTFLEELGRDCYYYLPMDYFNMAVLKPDAPNQDVNFVINSGASAGTSSVSEATNPLSANDYVSARTIGNAGGSPLVSMPGNVATVSPLTMKLAFQMLRWANKNTVIGRSIREYLRVHFGVTDVNPIDDGGVYRIGASRTNIQISDVMSTAESAQGYLGEYGGKGIGYGDSETFDFTADKFGVWITLTAVVPESGYYQGYMLENRHKNRYQFFNPEFDALGYQVLERGEVMDDYCYGGAAFNPASDFKRTVAFGFVPRYSEYKVGRNIVNGDLSLKGLQNSMSPYTLDRRISGGQLSKGKVHENPWDNKLRPIVTVAKPDFVPSAVYSGFRRIDPTDHLGQYNRIFNYGGNDLDHFIINSIFDVEMYAPMKSLTTSFDTIDDGEKTTDITHS